MRQDSKPFYGEIISKAKYGYLVRYVDHPDNQESFENINSLMGEDRAHFYLTTKKEYEIGSVMKFIGTVASYLQEAK